MPRLHTEATMAAAVAVQFCDCSASALSTATWNEGKLGPSHSRPWRSRSALKRSVSPGRAAMSWRTCSTRIGTSRTSARDTITAATPTITTAAQARLSPRASRRSARGLRK